MSSDKWGIHIIFCLHENICCGYSLEAPAQGLLMSTYNICFHGEIKLFQYLLVEKKFLIWSYISLFRALRLRKALGGGMRQAGVIAAAALYSLDNILPRLPDDHTRAKYIAKGIDKILLGHFNLSSPPLLPPPYTHAHTPPPSPKIFNP